MKIGDKVILKGKIVKVADIGDRMNYLVCFEHKTKKSSRFIEYWFSDVFIKLFPPKVAEEEK